MSRTIITYKDIAPGAADDAAVSASRALGRSVVALLPFGAEVPAMATGELNSWGLDGKHSIMPDDQSVAFWSADLSGADCSFANPPTITVVFDQQYSSTGITLNFDTATGDYCPAVNIKWYQGSTLKADVNFAPNAAEYLCLQKVTSYNKIVITLQKTKHPYRRAKLNGIVFGTIRNFDMSEIRKASITNEMDLLAASLPVSNLRWTLDSRMDVDFLFQLKQPMEVRNGDALIGVYYIDASRRLGPGLYDLDCFDAIGVLSESPFAGGVYTNKSAKALLTEILGDDFTLDIEAPDTKLTGAILPCTKREAAQQVLFAWGACASTDGRETVRVFVPGSNPSEIGPERTFLGAEVETAAIVTRVVVTAHTYTQDSDGGVEIGGVKYAETTTTYSVDNPNVTATDKQNVIEVTGATLVSPAIGQAVAQRVYDYYSRRNTHTAKIVWDGERLGDCVTVPNSWGGTNTGGINRLEVKLSNTIVATCRTVGV